MSDLIFLPGDIIKAFRGIYFHFGVYVGNGRVVHFCSTGGNELDSFSADIVETSFSRFSKGDWVCVDKSEVPLYDRGEIVRRARSEIGTKLGTYNLLSNNCEHFANWCRCGKLVSHQKILVESLVDTVASTAPFLGALKEVVTAVLQEDENAVSSLYTKRIS